MNLLYLKYAIEVANCGSVNRAAEKLFIDQPNLSRAIKELEGSLGVAIFERSSRGMKLTPQGEEFLVYANRILKQVDAVETMFKSGSSEKKQIFSISVPRASYISEAFSSFVAKIPRSAGIEFYYKETNAHRAVKNVTEDGYDLGIIRYAEQHDKQYKAMLDSKGLTYELLTEFTYRLVMSRDSALAQKPEILFSDLSGGIEIAHGDPFVPSLSLSQVKKEELPETARRILVFERASQFELLCRNPDAFMWMSEVPEELLTRYGLVQRTCVENTRRYRDVIIYRKDYRMTPMDQAFITELCGVKRKVFRA